MASTRFTRYAVKDNKDGTFYVLEAVSKPYTMVIWVQVGGPFQSRQHAATWLKDAAKLPAPTLEYFAQDGEPFHKNVALTYNP